MTILELAICAAVVFAPRTPGSDLPDRASIEFDFEFGDDKLAFTLIRRSPDVAP